MRVLRKLGLLLILIPAAAVLAAVYGALHDQLSYTVSSEYYTRFKFEQFAWAGVGTMPARVGAAVVGALATWWVGLLAGAIVGGAGLAQREPREMWRATLQSFGVVAAVALVAGLIGLGVGYAGFGSDERAVYVDWWRPPHLVSPRRFFAVGMMHNASYLGGALGVALAVGLQLRSARASRRRRVHVPISALAG